MTFCTFTNLSNAQFLMDMLDTSKDMGKGLLSIYQKFDRVKMVGYIQPQFQVAQEKGIQSFNGGDFAANVNNRFMLRRGRIRIEYVHFGDKQGPSVQFAFQFDGTERGVVIRDFWGRIFENKYELFTITAGMFARPFGYEVNLSSIDRESPERGRMSQLLMKTERDLGAMVSFEPRKKNYAFRYFKVDAGFFNGQGLTAPGDFDSHKDFISRIAVKPYPVTKKSKLSAGLSYFNGGFLQNTPYIYKVQNISGTKSFIVDSSIINKGQIAPRQYYGADIQLKLKNKVGFTEFRAEFITGTQTSRMNSTETPFALLVANEGYYIRKFNGAYFYFLQNIFSVKHQLVLKCDWYDPNTSVRGLEIGKPGSNFTVADIKYTTWGAGYIYYINDNVKLLLWYEKPVNENTSISSYDKDVKDDIFTTRLQFRF